MLISLLPALFLQSATPSAPGFFNAGQLKDRCESGASADISFCFAYIAGVYDTARAYETWLNLREFCTPPTISQGELRRGFIEYLDDKPGFRSGEAASVIVVALKLRYPCTPNAASLETPSDKPVAKKPATPPTSAPRKR